MKHPLGFQRILIVALILALSQFACNRGAQPETKTGRVLLNEVLFSPSASSPQFVELKNGGNTGATLNGYRLTNEKGSSYSLPSGLGDLPATGVLLILFDGKDQVDRQTIHASPYGFLNRNSGYVELAAADGTLLDRVAWGQNQLYPVRLSRGGRVLELVPGTTIGRFPLSTAPGEPADWLPFGPDQASPGAINPNPSVEALLPINGAIISEPGVELSWYPIAGAAQYRVQVSVDAAFTAPSVDQTVPVPPLKLDSLSPGDYYWRVQALAADGAPASFSPSNLITLATVLSSALKLSVPVPGKALQVPMIYQHKDTGMLMLELNRETGAHAWDVNHQRLDQTDPADNMNCGLASTSMVNAFFGGQLSQDRIGYEVFKDRRPGPEQDLNYGYGLNDNQQTLALRFALGAAPNVHPQPYKLTDFWKDITTAINGGTPVVATNPTHVFVVTGYSTVNGKQLIMINDPWAGSYQVNITAPMSSTLNNTFDTYFLLPSAAKPTSDEQEIRKDSDGDGVVDFDETQRFHTNFSNPDSDQDGVKDKAEIRASVFDTKHGYALLHPEGRDFDGDKLPMELDPDSDGGGCFDGMEDINGNGKYEVSAGETYNFDQKDDACIAGTDTIVVVRDTQETTATSHITSTLSVTFSLKAKKDGKLEGLAQGIYNGAGQETSDTCNQVFSVGPLVWGATLKGQFQGLGNGKTQVSFAATPDHGPEYVLDWIGCSNVPANMEGPTWTGASGTLVNGVCDFHFNSNTPVGIIDQTTHIQQTTGRH